MLVISNTNFNMKYTSINDKITFGKFRGMSLREIFCGKEFLDDYSRGVIENSLLVSFNEEQKQFTQVIRMSLGYDRIMTDKFTLECMQGDEEKRVFLWHQTLERLNSQASYLGWAMREHKSFAIAEDVIAKLESMSVYMHEFIDVEDVDLAIQRVKFGKLHSSKGYYSFTQYEKNRNKDKLIKLYNR